MRPDPHTASAPPARPLWIAAAIGLIALAVTLVASSPAHALERNKRGWLKRGDVAGRFGLGMTSQLGEVRQPDGTTTTDTVVWANLGVGIAYAASPRVAFDFDTSFDWNLNNGELVQVGVEPGLRYFLHPRFYARSAFRATTMSPTNLIALAGLGAFLRFDRASMFLEMNVIPWSQRSIDPPFFPRMGVVANF